MVQFHELDARVPLARRLDESEAAIVFFDTLGVAREEVDDSRSPHHSSRPRSGTYGAAPGSPRRPPGAAGLAVECSPPPASPAFTGVRRLAELSAVPDTSTLHRSST